ncbi:hypothetical protein D3C80_2020590 [compost metagenome]
MTRQLGPEFGQGLAEDAAQLHRPDQMIAAALAIELPDRLPGGVERLAAEGFETGQ